MMETEQNTMQEVTQQEQNQERKFDPVKAHILIFVLILLICGIQAVYQLTNSVSASVMLHSVDSANGQNPDGSPFSIMELFQDETMERASEKLEGKLTAAELRSHLTVSDAMSSSSFAQLEQSIFDGEDENTYFPTAYLVTYSTVSEQIKSRGFLAQCSSLVRSLFLPSKTKILNAVLQSYQEYYGETYLNYASLFELDWAVVDAMDYYNRYEALENATRRLLSFLEYKHANSLSQKADSRFTGYYDLSVELHKGLYQKLESYQSYVTQNGVTDNKEELMRQFAYMQAWYEEETTRKTQQYNVLKEAIEMYDSTTTKVVFIPALDGNQEFYMNRTKVGLDYLSEQADTAKVEASSAKYAAKQYSYLQTCFNEEYVIDEYGNKRQVKNKPSQKTHASELYETLKGELQRITEEAAQLTAEGTQTSQEDLQVGKPYGSAGILSVGMSAAKKFAVLLMAAYVVIYTNQVLAEKIQRKNTGA